jgi:hypothetical protein
MPAKKVHDLLLTHAGSLQAAVDQALQDFPVVPRIAILAHATSTIPMVQS